MFSFASIEQYHAQLKEGSITCLQAVEHYLERIDESRHLNAFVEVYANEAMERASRLDHHFKTSGEVKGLLFGVVVAIKDVICYKDHHTTAASSILKGFTSVYSATVVERMLEQGAIIIGSVNCDEFAMGSTNENSCYGKVLNALDNERVPGGSSGGSAVAVQAGLCMVSLGSDTGGSVRQPADFCGIVGLKPTYGRISRYGLIAYASSFDQVGIFGNNIADVAVILTCIAGCDAYDSTASQQVVPNYHAELESKQRKPARFALFKEALSSPANDPEIAAAINAYAAQLRTEGHEVEEISFDLLDYIVPAYYVLTTAEASSNLSRYDGVKFGYRDLSPDLELTDFYENTRSQGFGQEVKRRIMLGSFVLSAGYYDAYFTRAQKVRRLLVDRMELVFRDFDFILLPTSPVTAFKFGEKMDDPIAMYMADIYTVLANLAGVPAISLPLFRHSNGLPFGLQLMANQFNEVSLLRISKELLGR